MNNLKNFFPLLLATLIISSCWIFNPELVVINPEKCFSFDESLENWTVDTDESWYWTANGKAESHNWDDRPAIVSDSLGAIVFNGDSLSAKEGVIADSFMITSPLILTPTVNKLGVTFKQYFKNFKGEARLEVKPENGDWHSYPLNENFGNFMESLPDTSVFVDISDVILPTTACFNIRFVYKGEGSFWIIDDVCVEDITARRVTKPFALAKKLCDNNYPFLTDALGGAYIPNEVVVELADTSKADSIRELFQITEYESCNCNNIELWKSPIVLTPIKIMSNHFPTGIDSLFIISENLPQNNECIIPSYSIVKQTSEICEVNDEDNFAQYTSDTINNSGMLLIRGQENTQFTFNSDSLAKDSLYVLSFYAQSFIDSIPPVLEVNIAGVPFDTVLVSTTDGWGRYDVLLKDTISGGQLSLQQTSGNSIYAIDDVCLSQYILADNTIIDLNGVIERGTTSIDVNEGDPNYYNFDTQPERISNTIPNIDTIPNNDTIVAIEKIVAVLDTGIDYNYDDDTINIKNKIYHSSSSICFENDNFGYNFVDSSLPPYDDSHGGHGTHVAGIIVQNIPDSLTCDYRLLPVKTHDSLGVSTLFRVSCGITYATQAGSDFINASWGYYGEESPILRHTIENADVAGVTVVCSAGNDALDVLSDAHWPSAFDLPNVITVAATNDTSNNQVIKIAEFSNTNASRVKYGTAGVNIKSSVPNHAYPGANIKDGTSMAAPRILSLLLVENCICPTNNGRNFSSYLNSVSFLDTVNFSGIENYQYVDADTMLASIKDICQ